jgi:hypothetical protein
VSEAHLEHSTRVIYNVHDPSECAGRPCAIHNRSDHHMRAFPQHWRDDRKLMERTCPHGVGHPDPDDINPDHVHGCDGCCAPGQDWCAFHHEMEQIRDGDIVCGECWHRYRGPDDLVAVNNTNWAENRTFDQIFSCPLCIHDF